MANLQYFSALGIFTLLIDTAFKYFALRSISSLCLDPALVVWVSYGHLHSHHHHSADWSYRIYNHLHTDTFDVNQSPTAASEHQTHFRGPVL